MSKLISKKEQEEFVKAHGWSTWYNEAYWVHPKTVSDPSAQDYTSYGMDLNSAYCFEKLSLPKFQLSIFPITSMAQQGLNNRHKIEKLLEILEK